MQRMNTYWMEQVRQERRCRSILGDVVPYQALEKYFLRDARRARSFVTLTTLFSRIEVPQGCYIELAADVSYIWYYLMEDDRCGWWRVFYVVQLMEITTGVIQDI